MRTTTCSVLAIVPPETLSVVYISKTDVIDLGSEMKKYLTVLIKQHVGCNLI